MKKLLLNAVGMSMVSMGRLTYERFIKNTQQAQAVNDRLLQVILKVNQNTEYGRRHRFAAIRSAEEFRAALPLAVYDDYRADIDRMARGEQNILTAEPVCYFGISTGTTGQQKMIPVTRRAMRSSASTMAFLPYGILHQQLAANWHYGRGLNLMNLTIAGQTPGGIPKGAATAGGMRSMERMIPLLWVSPVEMLKCAEKFDASYLHLRFALEEESLTHFSAPFISSLLDLMRSLEQNWPRLVNDVAKGTIDSAVELSPELRVVLQRRLRPNPRRATALSVEFEKGFDGIVPRIWPGALYVCSVAGGGFTGYAERIRPYIRPLPVYSGIYAASESLIGVGRFLDQTTYTIAPTASYFEFIPLSGIEQTQPQTLSLNELSVGESYEIVLTSFKGLYRYRLADIVRVTGYYHSSPEIEFLCRRHELINLVGEKTSEMAAQHAVQTTFTRLARPMIDFTVMADVDCSPGRYVFFVEVDDDLQQGNDQAQMELERELCLANPTYDFCRRSEKISPLELKIVRTGTFAGLKTLLLTGSASSGQQIKTPRAVKDARLIHYLQEQIVSSQPTGLPVEAG